MNEQGDLERNQHIAEDAAIREIMDHYGVSYDSAKVKLHEIREQAKQYNAQNEEQE